MADGSTKSIEAIAPGDRVLAYNDASRATEAASVIAVQSPRTVDHYFALNENIRVTASQPVLCRGRWVDVGELEVGDFLTGANGSPVLIYSIRRVDAKVAVFNFQVGALKSYIAGGIVAHNKEIIDIGPCPGGEGC